MLLKIKCTKIPKRVTERYLLICIPFIVVISFSACKKSKHTNKTFGGGKETILHNNTKSNTDRPNIIFILTDDQRYDALGASGNSLIHTPHIDQLARSGVLFQNSYVTTSICCVSRASILTGQYQSRHHINDFNTNLTATALAETYPALLKNAGYKLGFIGKFGIGNNPPGRLFDYWVNSEAGDKSQPDYVTLGKNGRPIHDTDTIGHAVQEFLDRFANKEPFCLSVSSN